MKKRGISHRVLVVLVDLSLLLLIDFALLVLYQTNFRYLTPAGVLAQVLLSIVTVFGFRFLLGIYRQVWHEAPHGSDNTVAVHIRHLREKIELDPAQPRHLKVVFGQGYILEQGRQL